MEHFKNAAKAKPILFWEWRFWDTHNFTITFYLEVKLLK